jgi:hypothetical protein
MSTLLTTSVSIKQKPHQHPDHQQLSGKPIPQTPGCRWHTPPTRAPELLTPHPRVPVRRLQHRWINHRSITRSRQDTRRERLGGSPIEYRERVIGQKHQCESRSRDCDSADIVRLVACYYLDFFLSHETPVGLEVVSKCLKNEQYRRCEISVS